MEGLTCKPGHLLQPCQHCGQHSTGLCRLLVSRKIGSLQAEATGAGTWAHTMETERDWLALVVVPDMEDIARRAVAATNGFELLLDAMTTRAEKAEAQAAGLLRDLDEATRTPKPPAK